MSVGLASPWQTEEQEGCGSGGDRTAAACGDPVQNKDVELLFKSHKPFRMAIEGHGTKSRPV